jgi:hypothetical protein
VSVAGADPTVLENRISHWDYATGLELYRSIALEPRKAFEELELQSDDARLLAVVTLGTGGGRFERRRTVLWAEELSRDRPIRDVEVTLHPGVLSGGFTLSTEILFGSGTPNSRIAPRHAGARLWKDAVAVSLEPDAGRFPIEVVSFRTLMRGGPDKGLWYLDWSAADIDRDFASCTRLYLNADEANFVARVTAGDETVLRLMMGPVMSQMVRGLLDQDGFDLDLFATRPSSLGGTVASWIAQAFPNQSFSTVSALARASAPVFEASLGGLWLEEEQDA